MVDVLTPSQLKVVKFPYLPNSTLKVAAGPGSGKTLTLLHKVHHLIESGQVAPNEILILSLTNKAVDNVLARLFNVFKQLNEKRTEDELREVVGDLEIHTIHGLASRVVIENEGIINVIEENGWRGLMKLVSEDFWKRKSPRIPSTKDFKKLFEEYRNNKTDSKDVVKKINDIMQNCGVVTNEELIVRASRYLDSGSIYESAIETIKFTRSLKDRVKVVIIDEFQDLYPSLLPLIQQVSLGKQLILFGDSNQSIYSFLGSNAEVMKGIEAIHAGRELHVMHLHDNFRCTPEIMATASQVVHSNQKGIDDNGGETICKSKCGVDPVIANYLDPLDELEFVRDQIIRLVCASARLSDIAILTRTNSQMQLVADYLQSSGINTRKLTAQPDWLTDIRIQFLMDLMKALSLSYREETIQLDNSVTRPWKSDFSIIVTLSALKGVGNNSIQVLYNECLRQHVSLWRYISSVPQSKWPVMVTNKRKISSYVDGLKKLIKNSELMHSNNPMQIVQEICLFVNDVGFQNLQPNSSHDADQFKQHLEDMYATMKVCFSNRNEEMSPLEWFLQTHFEQSLALYHRANGTASDGDTLQLSTIHSSKGLEFPIVFLMGGLSWFQSLNHIENNVLYVGMTRAKNLLYLLNTKHPRLGNTTGKNDILSNNNFWRYYNTDLNRVTSVDSACALQRYESLQRKLRRFAVNVRPFSKLSMACHNSFSKLTRYVAR